MEEIQNKMRRSLLFLLLFGCSQLLLAQVFSESDLKIFAEKVNEQIGGVDVGNGVSLKNCITKGRTLIYNYDVPSSWLSPENIQDELIKNFKNNGIANVFFNNDVDVDFYYYEGSELRKKVSVKSEDFYDSPSSRGTISSSKSKRNSLSEFKLGSYISIEGHPKAKDVNLKIKAPTGWEVEEGERPNIVKKFSYESNVYLILIKDFFMFVSRNEAREIFDDEDDLNDLTEEYVSFLENPKVLNQKIVTIDTYPALETTVAGYKEQMGVRLKMILKMWVIFYEDKVIHLQSTSLYEDDFKLYEPLYDQITNSVIFPEQYN